MNMNDEYTASLMPTLTTATYPAPQSTSIVDGKYNEGDDKVWNTTLVGTKGYFRVAWKVERNRPYPSEEAIVLKTLK